MRVTMRGGRIRVPEQGTDQRQAGATAGKLGGEAVAQIMDAQAGDASGLADAGASCP